MLRTVTLDELGEAIQKLRDEGWGLMDVLVDIKGEDCCGIGLPYMASGVIWMNTSHHLEKGFQEGAKKVVEPA